MKIMQTYKAQKELINIIYEKIKDMDNLKSDEKDMISDKIINFEYEHFNIKYEMLISECMYIGLNHKVSFIIGSIITNLDLKVWYKVLKIRSIARRSL